MNTTTPPLPLPPSTADMEPLLFLHSLINKNLRVTTTDSRMFWGNFKCTDSESNVILRNTYEYRHPTTTAAAPSHQETTAAVGTVRVDMTSRFLGLVVVPGRHIVKIEVEEFASQMRSKQRRAEARGVVA
ncbi:hypothetical protein B0T18DRAFT_429202 [Schizothecium vesticola]|uniref:Sm domain-containing protein n=1 Tax=Schizothecium vesticola TaxID=314040 RepID=A0AA40EVB2_9PEZI|nr:hypothetical protein B0T18DRAFT_429202 [Schizothecium vesticola]